MKSILNKIEFNYTYLLVALGFVITGHFANLVIFTSLIIIHELGHFLMATIFKYKVSKIIIYPYGGITKFDSLVNTKIEKDFLIAVSGLFIQIIYFGIISFLFYHGLIREYIYHLFCLYHKSMVIFNLLPIIPLDGSKIVNLILSKYVNFNLANNITVFISFIIIILILASNVYEKNYSFILIIGVLLQNIYRFYSEIKYIYNRFMLERYLYNFNYQKIKVIKDRNKMYKNRKDLFNKDNKIISEKVYLDNFFNKKF